MATVDRPLGHISQEEEDEIREGPLGFLGDQAKRIHDAMEEAVHGKEDGTRCAGCEKEIELDSGVECYCAVEDFGYAHEQYRWCTQDCFNRTHEDCHPDPPDREEYDG